MWELIWSLITPTFFFSKGAFTYNRKDLSISKIYQKILPEDDSRKDFHQMPRFSGLHYHLFWALQAPISLEKRSGFLMVEQKNIGTQGGNIIYVVRIIVVIFVIIYRWCVMSNYNSISIPLFVIVIPVHYHRLYIIFLSFLIIFF